MISLTRTLSGGHVCICVGAGGVGKTTVAAAIALHLAGEGRRVALVTIDPARRLAGALGVAELGNDPHRVALPRGELWTMLLDPKRTLDDLVGRLTADPAGILENRIYRELSNAVAGTQEFAAVAKLYELARAGAFDAIVLDTPPSRNALDFVGAPARLTQFFSLGGRASRLVGRGARAGFAVLRRLTGVDLIGEIGAFLAAIAGLVEGFDERARAVAGLLRDERTAVVLVSSAEPQPVAEAIAFAGALEAAAIPVRAAVVNRVHAGGTADPDELVAALGDRLGRRVAANLADDELLAARDRRGVERLAAALPGRPVVLVADLIDDVHDLAGLGRVAAQLFD